MLGIINFTHSDPLYLAIEDKSLVVRDTPKRLLEKLLEGSLDCAMISLLEYFRHMDSLELVETATIHSRNATMSTLLISNEPGIRVPMKIAVTEHTKTTAFFLELVLKKLGLEYELLYSKNRDGDALLKEADYALVIGDEALKALASVHAIIWDIGLEFSTFFSLMPVFSVTVKRKGAKCERELEELDRALTTYQKYYGICAEDGAQKLGLDKSVMLNYFKTIKYDYNSEVRRTVQFVQSVTR